MNGNHEKRLDKLEAALLTLLETLENGGHLSSVEHDSISSLIGGGPGEPSAIGGGPGEP